VLSQNEAYTASPAVLSSFHKHALWLRGVLTPTEREVAACTHLLRGYNVRDLMLEG